MQQKNYCIGVDLGGTNIAVGLVSLDERKIVRSLSEKTNAPRSCAAISADIASLCRRVCEEEGITLDSVRWVGAVTPGIVKGDVVCTASNLGWVNAPFRKILASLLQRPVFIANDANAAAYAEMLWGAGEGKSSLVAVTLGTGVGGGIVIDGKLLEGFNGFAAEVGHIVIRPGGKHCGCGKRGCLEAYCSATALVKETKRVMHRDPSSALWKIVGGNISRVNGTHTR